MSAASNRSPAPGFFISYTLNRAWNIFQENWLTVLMLLSIPVVSIVFFMLLLLIIGTVETPPFWWVFFYIATQMVAGMWVTKGMMNLVRDQEVGFGVLMEVVPRLPAYLVTMLLYLLIVAGGLLLLIVPGVVWAVKYFLAPYLVIDKGLGPIEAIKLSAKMTDGVKWDLIGFYYSVVIFMYLGILALIVGLMVTIPVGVISFAVLYQLLLDRVESMEKRASAR